MTSNSQKIVEAAKWKPMPRSVPHTAVDPVRSARKYAGRLVENQEAALENLRFIRRNLERDEIRANIIAQRCQQTFPADDIMGSRRIAEKDEAYRCVRAQDLQHERAPERRPNADIDIRQLRSNLYGRDGVLWIPDSGVYTIERVAPAPGFADDHYELLPEVETLQRRRLLEQADKVDGPIWCHEVGLNNRRQRERVRLE